jgi:glycosyltransferase involved in cell wall biosynthesis
MKIAMVVPGRFHAFDFARALSLHHEVVVFTNYPKWAARRFGLAKHQARSFWIHGIVSRLVERITEMLGLRYPEAALHKMFGRWAATELLREDWDVVYSFSGVSQELISALAGRPTLKLVVRGSSHIRTQARILEEEERRTGRRLDRPSRWIIAREEAEYAMTDRIVVLSSFARESFLSEGESPERMCLLPLAASVDGFRPQAGVVEERCQRILSGEPLHILQVGTLSFQKGFWDISQIINALEPGKFRFRFVGSVRPEVKPLVAGLQHKAAFVPKQPQNALPNQYRWGDLFVLPTLQDGFAVVLAQAVTAVLPILTTSNSAGTDLVRHGETGFVLPIRSPASFVDTLKWCDTHREELAAIVRRIDKEFCPRDWSQVAADFERIVCPVLEQVRGIKPAFSHPHRTRVA